MAAREPADAVPTIVCVDDDLPLLRTLREQLLHELGSSCEIELASSGPEALELLEELAAEGAWVPLIISDHIMPGMRGAHLLARVHERYPAMLKVLLTGQADVDAVGQAVNDAGLYRFLSKPWHRDDLVLTVKEALRRAAHERCLAQRSAELARANQGLESSLQVLHATMDATLDGLLVMDREGVPRQINRQFEQLWAVPAALRAQPPGPALLDHVRAQLRDPEALRAVAGEPMVVELADQRCLEVARSEYRLHGEPAGVVYSFRDVTQREHHARAMRHQARYDSLSGLPNRLHFSEALDAALARARTDNGRVAVMFVDLDHFKRVNDTLGHDVGDRLLQSVAQRLAQRLREGDLIARWGGDEFTVLMPSIRHAEDARWLARRVLDALDEPFALAGESLRMSASVGVATYPADGEDAQALLRRADMALYRVKQEGRGGVRCFRHSAFGDLDAVGSLSLESDLRRAVQQGELTLHYQPQFDARSGAVIGVEALARWQHAELGWIGPDVFIPLAERSGDIVALGAWVLDAACAQAVRWRDAGFGALRIAVNISPVQFVRGDLLAGVAAALARSGLAPQALELEITESVALHDLDGAAAQLAALRRLGVRIALDDFGTGHASLAYLKALPCDTLKIDRSFIGTLHAGGKDAVIVRAVLALAEGLGMAVVAEGVETELMARALERLGCPTLQGYWLSRPVDSAALGALLRQHAASGAAAVA